MAQRLKADHQDAPTRPAIELNACIEEGPSNLALAFPQTVYLDSHLTRPPAHPVRFLLYSTRENTVFTSTWNEDTISYYVSTPQQVLLPDGAKLSMTTLQQTLLPNNIKMDFSSVPYHCL